MEKMEVENMFLGAYNRQYFETHRGQCSERNKKFQIIKEENVDNINEQKS